MKKLENKANQDVLSSTCLIWFKCFNFARFIYSVFQHFSARFQVYYLLCPWMPCIFYRMEIGTVFAATFYEFIEFYDFYVFYVDSMILRICCVCMIAICYFRYFHDYIWLHSRCCLHLAHEHSSCLLLFVEFWIEINIQYCVLLQPFQEQPTPLMDIGKHIFPFLSTQFPCIRLTLHSFAFYILFSNYFGYKAGVVEFATLHIFQNIR